MQWKYCDFCVQFKTYARQSSQKILKGPKNGDDCCAMEIL